MSERKKKVYFLSMIGLFVVLNVLNTYFVTTQTLNRYIISFDRSLIGEILSIIGNTSILLLIVVIVCSFTKKPKKIAISLIIITFVLNFIIYILCFYTKFYRVAFSLFTLSIIRNPSGGFAGKMILDALGELVTYYRIFVFIPFFTLLIMFLVKRREFIKEKFYINFKKRIMASFICLCSCFFVLFSFVKSLENKWPYSTEVAQYGVENAGLYNYYLSEVILHIDYRDFCLNGKNSDETDKLLVPYNKNKESYTNLLDGNTYSIKDFQTGILKDKNVFVIQLESTLNFIFNSTFNNVEISPYMNSFIKEDNVFYFDNAYTNAGIGNTSDAEFSLMTGLPVTGDMTITWEFHDRRFDIEALGDKLNDNYVRYSYNPTTEIFYNHKDTHENLYKMTEFRGVESYKEIYPVKEYPDNYLTTWISDQSMLEFAAIEAKNKIDSGKNVFSFVETITPHSPFAELSNEYSADKGFDVEEFGNDVPQPLVNYLNQVHYNDKIIYNFLKDATNPESKYYMKDTLFILYGDHGNCLYKGMYEKLYNKSLTDMEHRKILQNIPIIVFDPSGEIQKSINDSGVDIEKVLHQAKNQIDIHRTITNLLGLSTNGNIYGVNIFSGEPSFGLDAKNFDIFFDDWMYSVKTDKAFLYNDKAVYSIDKVKTVSDFKKYSDTALNLFVYKHKKK